MSSLIEIINKNLPLDNPFISAIALGILFMILYDLYHLIFSSVFSWFRK